VVSKGREKGKRGTTQKKGAMRVSQGGSKSKKKSTYYGHQRILVTGASGCVGGFLVSDLLRRGYQVVATDLKGKSFPAGRERLTIIEGDLSDPVFTASLVEDMDAVINTAAVVDISLPYSMLAPINVDAVRVLFEKAKQIGVKHFIQFSSGALYKASTTRIRETVPLEARNDYAKSKMDAEMILFSKPRVMMPYVTVIRPALIYGPRGKVLMASIATLPPLVKSLGPYYVKMVGGPKTNMVHGEDVARAAVFLLNNPRAYGEVFNVADNDPRHFTDFINSAMEAYGLKPLGSGIPYPPVTLLNSIMPYIARDEIFNPLNRISSMLWNRIVKKYRLQKELSPRIDKESLEFGIQDIIFDASKIKALGFQLKYPRFQKGWKNTVEWYQENHWIPRSGRR
jgi:nucleoside-diphosphate-sugar epimerase